jgi:single-stranded-DNA-specific exonuclease
MRWTDAPIPSAPLLPGLHPLVAQTLTRRGVTGLESAQAFLDPETYCPAPAFDLPGLPAAAARVWKAIRDGERICVWGDFDVDGQTSTTLLFQALTALKADVTCHIPVRQRESHGINIPHLQEIIDAGAQLILTCDTGITAHEAVDYACSRSVDVIITDHHDLPPELPKAVAVVDPKMLQPEHPLATLSGVGVAYKLAEALLDNDRSQTLGHVPSSTVHLLSSDLLDLVALGLVADVAILRGDARYLVQKGLAALRTTQRLGLKVMMELAEMVPANLTEEHIGFTLAPRLNALGRLGDANPIVELLTTSSPARARLLATQLENYNAQRQLLTNQVTQAAEAQLRADPSLLAAPVLIVGHPTWPGGVIGIAAARLVERYGKPAIVLSTPAGEPVRGSARSVEGFHITEAIAAQGDLLLNFGGHPMAAGLSLDPENLPAFSKRMLKTAEKMLAAAQREEPTLEIDAWLTLPELTLDLAAALEPLAPFGPGNPKLVLASQGLRLESTAPIGRNKEHLKLTVADEAGNTQQVLWWNGSGEELPSGKFDLAYTVRAADWRGSRQVQMEYVDFRVIESEKVEVKSKKVEIVDYRAEKDPRSILEKIGGGPSTLIWAEADEKERVGGKNRNELTRADHLVIWSIPPSPEELHAALEKVQPRTVSLVAAHPDIENTENFIARLMGLLKFVINQRDGKATYTELAAASGQRVLTVKRGLNWLIVRGKVTLKHEEDGVLWLASGKNGQDIAGAARLWVEVQSLLAEAAAYRAHFKRADKETLFA